MKESDYPHSIEVGLKNTLGMTALALVGMLAIPLIGARAVTAEPTAAVYLPFAGKPPDMLAAGHLMVTEVMNYPHPVTGDVEWIEIFNASRETVNLRPYKVGDEEVLGGSEGMLQFPPGAALEPGGVIVIAEDAFEFQSAFGFTPDFEFKDSGSPVPDMFKYAAWSSGNVSLVNSGDEVLLLDRYDHVVDAVSWGSSNWAFSPDAEVVSAGQTIERFPGYRDTDTAAEWLRQISPSPGQINTALSPIPPTPRPSPVPNPTGLLISEVLFDSSSLEPAAEWIEIYNPGQVDVPLHGYKIGDEETAGGSEGMFRFPDDAIIRAGARLLIAVSAEAFYDQYRIMPDYETSGTSDLVPDLQKYETWSGGGLSLSNAGDEVLLLDGGDIHVDAVSWGSSAWAFSPSVPRPPAAEMSIERFPAEQDTDSSLDWRIMENPTPGR